MRCADRACAVSSSLQKECIDGQAGCKPGTGSQSISSDITGTSSGCTTNVREMLASRDALFSTVCPQRFLFAVREEGKDQPFYQKEYPCFGRNPQFVSRDIYICTFG